MSILLVAMITMAALIFTVVNGGFIGLPLLLGLTLFSALAAVRGHTLKAILSFQLKGAKKALVVLRVFVFIGMITGSWLASGTVAALMDLGLTLLHPAWFILFAFAIPAAVSFLLGTSFGTISTIGVALMLIGRGAGLPEPLVAGAIISGSYFGDRGSPMSSSANLVASLTSTDLHQNVLDMMKTAVLPLMATLAFYAGASWLYPLDNAGIPWLSAMQDTYALGFIALLPALTVLVLGLARIDVKWAMGISVAMASGVALWHQQLSPQILVESIFWGYQLPLGHQLAALFKGGGILSMLKPSIVVTTACALAGLMDGTNMLKALENFLQRFKTARARFGATIGISLLSGSFGANQTIAIVFTEQLMDQTYGEDRRELAMAIENSAVLIAPLIPWNIAALVPTTTLAVSPTGFLPFAVFLYLVPLIYWLFQRGKSPNGLA